ncbi:receptor-type adenylate cyclase GRESAG 4, putative [Trypanosoma brucei brucei TREU927]|uniref:adenylate cyclase n=1 Tax=Trypanosoma brucei brucei (strain 927/4 GUTat10.1) TaxID=185431 RepID=Q388U2_TRYB2|nr:receptor-type adenylate cyclase GRESAG 4, putative [Trypanosoma brucei brucei TREU927]EAN78678.1 receptor-type adenylate cyclase GRESAG 4, putative [Trypanosoma brucei brucei TREU927]
MKAPALLLFLLSACAASPPTREAGGVQVTVTIVSLMYSKNWPAEYINAVNAGFNASLAARNWVVAPGVNVSVVPPPSYDTPAYQHLEKYLENVKDDNSSMVVVLGPMGEESSFASYDTLKKHGLVGFAPMTGAAGFETYLPHLYFLRPGFTGELIALIRYAVTYLRVLRLGFTYLEGMMGGTTTYENAVDFLSRMGYTFCCIFTVHGTAERRTVTGREFDVAWNEFAGKLPQAVIVVATVNDEIKNFVKNLVADPRTADAYLLAPSLMQKSIVTVWKEALEAANATFVPRRVIQTGTNPLANDTDSRAISRFQGEMRDYLTAYGEWAGVDDAECFLKDDAEGELMVAGWLAGEVLSQALRSHGWMNNRTAFMESLYEQRRYVVDNIVIGDFGGSCEDNSTDSGAICQCNRGGRKVYMKEIAEGYRLRPLVGGYIVQSQLECNSDPAILQPPLSGLAILINDRQELTRAVKQFKIGTSAVSADGEDDDVDRLVIQVFDTKAHTAFDDLKALQQRKILTALFGVVTESLLELSNVTFIDPMVPTPHLNTFNRNVIRLSPTLEQQLYVHATYLSSIRAVNVHCIVRSNEAARIIDVLRKTLITFGLNLSSTKVLEARTTIRGNLPTRGSVFLIGLVGTDIAAIEEHLRTHERTLIFVQYSDIALLYNEFVQTFNNTHTAERLVFATSLPHWADANTTSETVRRFQDVISDVALRTPLSLLGFATGRLMQRNLQRMPKVTPELLSDLFFEETVITVDDMRYGPFRHYDCVINDVVTEDNCITNFGAADISVWSMARALRPHEPVLQEAMFPSMKYNVPNGNALTPAQLAGVIGGTSAALFLLLGLGVLLYFVLRDGRDNDNAPKEPTDPVTLIFTDVESSTALWAAHPELMPEAVAAHHSMIRSLISRHGCYEVKTVGDSFMIACKSPTTAVKLVLDLQVMFMQYDWGSSVFDDSYREFELRKADDVDGYAPPTALLDSATYGQYWNGLRVRVGVHTGLCDIRHDEVTKGYDYYGQVPNLAARTENVTNGGQVLLTHAMYLALSTAEREEFDVTPLGEVPLRGVPEPVVMYQLNAVPGRSFSALRLDRVIDVLEEGGDGTGTSGSDRASTVIELSESAQAIASSLLSLLGTLTPAQRHRTLMLFCERWRVALPRSLGAVWDDDGCREVIRRVAAKVGHVVDFHSLGTSERSSSTLSSASVIIIPNRTTDFDKF